MDIIVICLILGMYKIIVGLKAQPNTVTSALYQKTLVARMMFNFFLVDCVGQLSFNTTNTEKLMVETANAFSTLPLYESFFPSTWKGEKF